MINTRFAVITGTGATELEQWVDRCEDVEVSTPFGTVFIQRCLKDNRLFWHVNRHGAARPLREAAYELAALISTRPAFVVALARQGVEAALGISAVGKVNHSLTVGSVVIVSQYLTPKDRQMDSFATLIKVPGPGFYRGWSKPFNPTLSQVFFKACAEANLRVQLGGNLDNIPGPRFETDLDLVVARQLGIDVVGMFTVTRDSAFLGEVGIPLAAAAVVTDDPSLPLAEGAVERMMASVAPAVFGAGLKVIERISRQPDWSIPDAPEPVQGLRQRLELPELVHR